jgi:hypothetical protein
MHRVPPSKRGHPALVHAANQSENLDTSQQKNQQGLAIEQNWSVKNGPLM